MKYFMFKLEIFLQQCIYIFNILFVLYFSKSNSFFEIKWLEKTIIIYDLIGQELRHIEYTVSCNKATAVHQFFLCNKIGFRNSNRIPII